MSQHLKGMIPLDAVRHGPRDTTALIYEKGASEFHVRGGVCWPVEVSGQFRGCALVAGLDVEKNRVAILCETLFATIPTLLDPETQTITSLGVGSWFNSVWNTFYCHRFFVEAGAGGQHDRYGMEVRNTPEIQPEPRFKLIDAERSYYGVIQQHISNARLIYPKDGITEQAVVHMISQGPDQPTTHPIIRTLGCILNGYMRYPWRNADVEYTNVLY